MDSLVTMALVGLARQEKVDLSTGTPVDPLLAALPAGESERKFLLSAGARAVYYQAGKQAQPAVSTPEPAGPEHLRACSPEAARLLTQLMSNQHLNLLLSALIRMRERGLHLPYHLLPQALNVTHKEKQAALLPVLGERGRWLSQFDPAWKWVQDALPEDENGLPPDAEAIWQEGSTARRAEILRCLRAVDPEKARSWLEAVWKQEKAETRGDFLECLEVGLSTDDEPFLEAALDDRSSSVRGLAATLLARLPGSALMQRMRQRAQSLITRKGETLAVEPPQKLPKDWQHDGFVEKPPNKVAPRSWWLIQALSVIEPAFWEVHLGAKPGELFKLLAKDRWEMQVMEGWSKAAMTYHASDWIMPLWNWWRVHYQEALEKRHLTDYTYREQLIRHMPAQMAEQTLQTMLNTYNGKPDNDCWEMLAEVRKPWSAEFACAYLQLLRKHCTLKKITAESFNPYSDPWISNLPVLASALPLSCFGEAEHLWDLPDDSRWGIQYIRQELHAYHEILHIRQQIEEEII